jgi:hypothetical protein
MVRSRQRGADLPDNLHFHFTIASRYLAVMVGILLMTDWRTLAHKESGPALLGDRRVGVHGFDLCFGAIFATRGLYLLALCNQLFIEGIE